MATFTYRDKDGNNQFNAEGFIHVSKDGKTISMGMTTGDSDGETYYAYVPNHRAALLNLANDILAALDKTHGLPEGYDGFYTNFASASDSSDEDYEYNEIGVVRSY